MVFMISDDEVVYDEALHFLTDLIVVLDEHLEQLGARSSWDECARDSADHVAGFGFVACQKYITSIAAVCEVGKKEALDLGPTCSAGPSVVSVINAAANMWKHEDEWKDPMTRAQERTAGVLDGVLDEGAWEYAYVNVLYALSPDMKFSVLLDSLECWREELRALSNTD